MSNKRFLKYYTKMPRHPFYPKDRPFTTFEALLDLLVECHPTGQTDKDIPYFSKKWGWALPDTVNYFNALETMGYVWLLEGIEIAQAELWYDKAEVKIKQNKELVEQVVDCFNFIFGRSLTVTPYRQKIIARRIHEGRNLPLPIGIEQFKRVFEFKKNEWLGTDMEKFLEIETLCADKHFFKYLDQARQDYIKKHGKPKPNTTT